MYRLVKRMAKFGATVDIKEYTWSNNFAQTNLRNRGVESNNGHNTHTCVDSSMVAIHERTIGHGNISDDTL